MNPSQSLIRLASLLLAGLVTTAIVAGVANVAAAGPLDDDSHVPSMKVRIADLDLGSPDGVAKLYRRIDTAAHVVCNVYDDRSLVRSFPFRQCVAQSIDRAVTAVGDARLTAYYLEKTAPQGARSPGTLARAAPPGPR